MARGKALSEETKAAVMAALMTGQGINETARAFKISPSVVSGWKKEISAQYEQVRTQKGERIEDLTFDYLSTLLSGLKTQVAVVSTKEYLFKQPASEVAVLHGVMADKAFRLLSALPAGDGSSADADGGAEQEATA